MTSASTPPQPPDRSGRSRRRRRSPWTRAARVFFASVALGILILEVANLDGVLDQLPYGLLVLGTGLWILSFLVVLIDAILVMVDRKVGVRRPPPS